MELEGSLEEFSVPEILQFLSLHDANGVLRMKSINESVGLSFKKGKITAAAHKGEDFFFSINEYILRIGRISEDELEEYQKEAKELNVSVIHLLLQEKKIENPELREIILFKIQEIVDEALTWDSGRYSFEAGESLYSSSIISVELDSNALVMEGMKRIDEWPQIRDVLPSDSVSLQSKEKPEIDIELGDNEKRILEQFIDGITVGELVKITGLGKFLTYSAVYKLIEIGLISRVEEEKRGDDYIDKELIQKYKVSYTTLFKRIVLIGFILFNLFFFFQFKLDGLKGFIRDVKNTVQRVDK